MKSSTIPNTFQQFQINSIKNKLNNISWKIPHLWYLDNDTTLLESNLPLKKIYLAFPIDRYQELDLIIKEFNADVLFTVDKICEKINGFYETFIPTEELKQIAKLNDVFGYSKMAADALKFNRKLKRYKVMGDAMWFEGLTPYQENGKTIYRVNLGS